MEQLPLFDANGSIGCGAQARPDFRTPADLLAHMDRLGIARSLVWHAGARDLNPAWGNRRLTQALRATEGAAGRLFPLYTIAPTMLYQRGALQELTTALADRSIKGLRVFPQALRHRLDHLDPMVEHLLPHNPVLFIEGRGGLDVDGFLALAERFPSVPMVAMQVMWGQLATILDLMRRRENVYVDTSWLHTPETIELISERFGAERAVFGTGPKAHNGAGLAALAYADVSGAERALIAHGNLERLLGLPAASETAPSIDALEGTEARWRRFLAGEPVDAPIIDAHGHLGPSGIAVLQWADVEDQIDYTLQRMDRLQIETTWVSGLQALFSDPVAGNQALAASVQAHKGRFLGYLAFNPFYGPELTPRFDEFFADDFFVGFKLLCDYWQVPLTDPRFEPVWAYADEHHLPVLMHTWEGAFDAPHLLQGIVKDYPQAMFLLGHSGGGDAGRREAEELAQQNGNVYLEFCGSFTSDIPWEETIARVGATRVLFGTDQAFHDPAWELGRLLSLDAPWETLLPILGANARRILAARV